MGGSGDSSSSSDSDDDLARFAAVAVSAEQVTQAQQRIAHQGQQKLGRAGTSAKPPTAAADHPVGGDGDGDDDDSKEGQPLGIIEARIAAALNGRLERALPAALTQPTNKKPEAAAAQAATTPPASQANGRDEEGLGCGVRLFRRCKPGTPVTLPPDVTAAVLAQKRRLDSELKDLMTAKRIRAEVKLLQGLLNPSQRPPGSSKAPKNPSGDEAGANGVAAAAAVMVPEVAAEEFQGAVRRAIKQLTTSLERPSKQAKAVKKALKRLAVEGADIILGAGVQEPADGAVPLVKEKKKRKKKKKSEGAEGGSQPEAVARLTQVDGVVVDGKRTFVPYVVRTSQLLGRAAPVVLN